MRQSNLQDYVEWRGDLTFAQSPFTILDSLVFCQLSYTDMRTVFAGPGDEERTLRQVTEELDRNRDLSILLADGVQNHETYAAFVHAAARSKRFGDVMLHHYQDIIDKSEQIQFCAVTFRIDEHTDYIAFRGTDDSIVGWKEDFMISFEKIPAQDSALEYLKRSIHLHPERRYYVGGHSKGANLALYAAARLPAAMRRALLHVYVLDGPGLCGDVLDTSIVREIDPITTKIVPEYDVIGKIFEMPITDNRIVRSSETGILQHGILTWQMRDGGLDTVPRNALGSQWIGHVLDGWIGSVPPEDRKTFIDDLFDTMAAGGTDTFYELQKLGPDGFEKILSKAANVSRVSLDVATALPLTAAVGPEHAQQTKNILSRLRDVLQTNALVRALILIAGGICCMILPERMMPLTVAILMTAALGVVLVYTLQELHRNHWKLSAIRTQGYVCIFSIVVYLVMLVKEGALMLVSNLVYGILFLSLAYHILQRAHSLERWTWRWVGSLVEAALLIVMSIYILTAPGGTIRYFTFASGALFLVDGIIHLFLIARGRK